MKTVKYFGGMEGGGTKFICAVASSPDEVVDEVRFPTTTPDETLGQAIAFFQKHTGKLVAIGLAPFGPLDLDEASPTYGHVTATPKSGWSGADVLGRFRGKFQIPLAFDLEVGAAAFGEYFWVPENRKLDTLVYFTIGTGIGAGVIIQGRLVHGLVHPEAGHMRIPHDRKKDPFPGICPFHGDCFEGLASGPALGQRWRRPADTLPEEHPAWELEAGYIATALVNVILTVSPQRIVLGGGVMERKQLFPAIRQKVQALLNGYIPSLVILDKMDEYIVPPALGNRSGILGAIALAKVLVGRK
jgi:fructokinase